MIADRPPLVLDRNKVEITKERTSEELKSALVSTVTHELRTPLAAIKGYARTLLIEDAGWDEPTREEFLTTIAEESDKLGELVDNLLETSKIEAGVLQGLHEGAETRFYIQQNCLGARRELLAHDGRSDQRNGLHCTGHIP